MSRLLFLVLVCMLVSACSSVPVSLSEAREITPALQTEFLTPSDERTQKVVVILDDLLGPSVIKPKIFIDGNELCSLSQGEKVTFYVTPGVHQLGWSALTDGNYREQEFHISENLNNAFHLQSPMGDVVRFVREKRSE